MNYTKQTDCLTGVQIQNIVKKDRDLDCTVEPDANSMVMLRQTYMPNLVLGKTSTVHPIDRQDANENENEDFTQE